MLWSQEARVAERAAKARAAGVSQSAIDFSKLTGIDPMDVQTLERASADGLVIITRCPRIEALAYHGTFPAKPMRLKAKSDPATGLATGPGGARAVDRILEGRQFVSDYDLMCVWGAGDPPKKYFVSAWNGADRGAYPPESRRILQKLNRTLVSRLQHGCQDDFVHPKNPGLKPTETFAAFHYGRKAFLRSPAACKALYEQLHIGPWLYDDAGNYRLSEAREAWKQWMVPGK